MKTPTEVFDNRITAALSKYNLSIGEELLWYGGNVKVVGFDFKNNNVYVEYLDYDSSWSGAPSSLEALDIYSTCRKEVLAKGNKLRSVLPTQLVRLGAKEEIRLQESLKNLDAEIVKLKDLVQKARGATEGHTKIKVGERIIFRKPNEKFVRHGDVKKIEWKDGVETLVVKINFGAEDDIEIPAHCANLKSNYDEATRELELKKSLYIGSYIRQDSSVVYGTDDETYKIINVLKKNGRLYVEAEGISNGNVKQFDSEIICRYNSESAYFSYGKKVAQAAAAKEGFSIGKAVFSDIGEGLLLYTIGDIRHNSSGTVIYSLRRLDKQTIECSKEALYTEEEIDKARKAFNAKGIFLRDRVQYSPEIIENMKTSDVLEQYKNQRFVVKYFYYDRSTNQERAYVQEDKVDGRHLSFSLSHITKASPEVTVDAATLEKDFTAFYGETVRNVGTFTVESVTKDAGITLKDEKPVYMRLCDRPTHLSESEWQDIGKKAIETLKHVKTESIYDEHAEFWNFSQSLELPKDALHDPKWVNGFTAINKDLIKQHKRSVLKEQGIKAAYRVAATQLTKIVKRALISVSQKKTNDAGTIHAMSVFLDTDIGEAMIAGIIGAAIAQIPGEHDSRLQRLATEFQISGMTMAGNAIVDTIVQEIMPTIISALSSPESNTTRVMVESSKEESINSSEEVEVSSNLEQQVNNV